MLSITLVCVGKMRETYYISAFAEYAKRLGAYCRFDLVELPEQRLPERPSQKEIHAALEKEAQAIRARIPKGAAVIAMCVEGNSSRARRSRGSSPVTPRAARRRCAFSSAGRSASTRASSARRRCG